MRFAFATSLFTLTVCMTLASSPALAEPFTYAPDGCEVQSTFPEKPFFQTKCTGGEATRECAEIVSYTKTDSATGSALNFRMSCRLQKEDELNSYTHAIVEKSIGQMISDVGMEPYNITSNDEDNFRKSIGLSVGEKVGRQTIYTAQIWIGKTSMFTLEAEISGPQNPKLEETFAGILRETRTVAVAKADTNKPQQKKQEQEKGKQ